MGGIPLESAALPPYLEATFTFPNSNSNAFTQPRTPLLLQGVIIIILRKLLNYPRYNVQRE